ncbi:MAG: hypothetical protein IJD71_06835 [Clostridia bacterium]|nr:hypothetical protein [Clostridia bacterium]MBQ4132037.1 hypothetical protein [Clostridia bacterium]MBQ7107886.1 hypothetical protein [Clostridia bacterium]
MYTDKKSRVACLHCEYFEIKIISENDIPEEAYCEIKKCNKKLFDDICKNFKLKSGMHTKRKYPGKKQ